MFISDQPQKSGPKDKADYDLALAALKEGDFTLAETKFSDFIKQHPSSGLQSNATFWYAETFYRRGVYDKAAINYLQSYKKYPKGSKASDALLKLSYSLASLNKNKEACSMLDKLDSEFPKRPIGSIKRAREAKEKFRCQ
jgi:tol-pal system protein YbgF